MSSGSAKAFIPQLQPQGFCHRAVGHLACYDVQPLCQPLVLTAGLLPALACNLQGIGQGGVGQGQGGGAGHGSWDIGH